MVMVMVRVRVKVRGRVRGVNQYARAPTTRGMAVWLRLNRIRHTSRKLHKAQRMHDVFKCDVNAKGVCRTPKRDTLATWGPHSPTVLPANDTDQPRHMSAVF